MLYPDDWFRGKNVTVMGLGRFGGQIAVVRFLAVRRAVVTVTDLAPAERLAGALAQIAGLDVALHLGGHRESDFRDADLVVVSPAVPEDSPFLRLARDSGVPTTCEMNLFLERCRGRVIGITGTAGKSTTSAMAAAILTVGERPVWFGGNIGRSLLADIDKIQPDDLVVLELSSFQLEDAAALPFSPSVAVVTNIFPNHLDRHGTLEAYIAAKAHITRYQRPGDVLAVWSGDDNAARLVAAAPPGVRVWRFGERVASEGIRPEVELVRRGDGLALVSHVPGLGGLILDGSELPVPGEHNLRNAAGAAAAALAVGVPPERIGGPLRGFQPLPDRLELVAERGGVRWYNDSKSTTPEAGTMALAAFSPGRSICVAGGYDKGADLGAFAQALADRAKTALCLGQTGPALADLVRSRGGRAVLVTDLAEAVRQARRIAEPGDVVLLSPGCASWDMFDNYEARGRCFKELVLAPQ